MAARTQRSRQDSQGSRSLLSDLDSSFYNQSFSAEVPRNTQSPSAIGIPVPNDAISLTSPARSPSPYPKRNLFNIPDMLRYVVKWWLWELCGMGLSVSSIGASLAFAAYLDGKPISDSPYGLSPNTTVSALITVAKTTMLFAVAEAFSQLKWLYFWREQKSLSYLSVCENAAKGPWGSLIFLYRGLRLKAPLVACVGAFVTVVVLAMGPSAQQVIMFDSRAISAAGLNSSINATKTFLGWDSISGTDIILQHALQHALLEGLASENVSFGFACQSGNCSWPGFATLGICGSCVDVSHVTEVNLVQGQDYGIVGDDSVVGEAIPINYTATTPAGFTFLYNYTVDIPYPIMESQSRAPFNDSDESLIAHIAVVQQGASELAQNISKLNGYPNADSHKTNVTLSGANATALMLNATVSECAINWCAKSYQNVSVSNGTLDKYRVLQHPLRRLIDETDYNSHRGNSFYIYTTEDTWGHGSKPIHPFTDSIFLVPDGSTLIYIHHLLQDHFQFSSGQLSAGSLGLQYGTKVSDRIDLIASSLTNVIQSSRDSVKVPGTVWVEVTIIHIEWLWFTLSIGLVGLSMIFLVVVALSSYSDRMPTWKSSLMPLLFHGLNDWTIEEVRDIGDGKLEEQPEMQGRAKTIHVKLVRNDKGETRLRREAI
ncbi:hypothetical protein HD806DRAFT_510827 [Xylariaceae sp. AK1471]|nr:hypothetical protein HD806DRAFT_510827 [Xylariaceae sp. AK1471]